MGDAREWNADDFRASVLAERSVENRIVFSLQFGPPPHSNFLAAATSDGSVALHSIKRSPPVVTKAETADDLAKPVWSVPAHDGPAYGLLSFGEPGHEILASCGDDGRVALWRWKNITDAVDGFQNSENLPVSVFQVPQQRGAFGGLSPVAEVNGLAVDTEAGQIFCAAGDGCAYTWDLVTGQQSMVFQGHADYLHCISSRPSHKQIVTGSEDGTARIWDCRSARCTALLDPWNAVRIKRKPRDRLSWISCMAVDTSENWLVCGSGGGCLTLWNLPMLACATRIATSGQPQSVAFSKDEIVVVGTQPHVSRFGFGGKLLSQAACAPLSSYCIAAQSGVTAVGGRGGIVDVLSNFGSHFCTFCC